MHTFCEDRMISVPVTEHDSQLNFLTATASPFHCKKPISVILNFHFTGTLLEIKKLIGLVIASLINSKKVNLSFTNVFLCDAPN